MPFTSPGWDKAATLLASSALPSSPSELVQAIQVFTGRTPPDAQGWLWFWEAAATPEESVAFWNHTLPGLARLALLLPALFPAPVPLLMGGEEKDALFSQAQAACALAGAFFCLWPGRNNKRGSPDPALAQFPSFSFLPLFGARPQGSLAAKFRCLFAYFDVAIDRYGGWQVGDDQGTMLRFCRRGAREKARVLATCTRPLSAVHVVTDTLIEDVAYNGGGWFPVLEVDFANRYVGGGVLGNGAVQEEIRFVISPELLLSRLVCQVLGDDEVLFLLGSERFSSHTGYASSFEYVGPYTDTAPVDPERNERDTAIVAMDASVFRFKPLQFRPSALDRETRKALAGFMAYENGLEATGARPIVTGHWGCGAFGGDRELKFILQLLVASSQARELYYCMFGDPEFAASATALLQSLRDASYTVQALHGLVAEFSGIIRDSPPNVLAKKAFSLFRFVQVALDTPPLPDSDSDSDSDTDLDDPQPQTIDDGGGGGGGGGGRDDDDDDPTTMML